MLKNSFNLLKPVCFDNLAHQPILLFVLSNLIKTELPNLAKRLGNLFVVQVVGMPDHFFVQRWVFKSIRTINSRWLVLIQVLQIISSSENVKYFLCLLVWQMILGQHRNVCSVFNTAFSHKLSCWLWCPPQSRPPTLSFVLVNVGTSWQSSKLSHFAKSINDRVRNWWNIHFWWDFIISILVLI